MSRRRKKKMSLISLLIIIISLANIFWISWIIWIRKSFPITQAHRNEPDDTSNDVKGTSNVTDPYGAIGPPADPGDQVQTQMEVIQGSTNEPDPFLM
jgi:cytoskeletal protein RodZ